MAGLTVKQLNCRVTVRVGQRTETPLGKAEAAPKPSLLYALPNAAPALESGTTPGHTASGAQERRETMGEGAIHDAQPRRADPKTVADRVYQLMLEEVRLTRMRGGT